MRRIVWLFSDAAHQPDRAASTLLESEPHRPRLPAKDPIAGKTATLEPIQHDRRARSKLFAELTCGEELNRSC
jgi:hypothetical protein